MNIIYFNEHVKCYLTTDSPASSHGIPVMRIERTGVEASEDFGPSDLFSTGLSAAQLCCETYRLQDQETQKMSKAFCAQWKAGPQPELEEEHRG